MSFGLYYRWTSHLKPTHPSLLPRVMFSRLACQATADVSDEYRTTKEAYIDAAQAYANKEEPLCV